MKIIIAGYGNVGKKLTEYSIKNNYETIILSRQKIRRKNLTFLALEDLTKIKDLENSDKNIFTVIYEFWSQKV